MQNFHDTLRGSNFLLFTFQREQHLWQFRKIYKIDKRQRHSADKIHKIDKRQRRQFAIWTGTMRLHSNELGLQSILTAVKELLCVCVVFLIRMSNVQCNTHLLQRIHHLFSNWNLGLFSCFLNWKRLNLLFLSALKWKHFHTESNAPVCWNPYRLINIVFES